MLPSFEIEQNKQLRTLHTFAVPWRARFFVSVSEKRQLHDALEIARGQSHNIFVLGGGSNILPTSTFSGLVIHNQISGRSVISDNDTDIVLEIGAGESWHDTVLWCADHGYYGLENMALIPGTVGGAVVQNIGAYDVEISQYVDRVHCYNTQNLQEEVFTAEQCEFEYRNSLFKKNQGQYVVTSVELKLRKTFSPVLTYAPLRELQNSSDLPVHTLIEHIIAIRQSKLPDWNVVGTAGSFFANPRVLEKIVRKLQKKYKDMPVFTDKQTGEKIIPAGWLIEHSKLDKKVREKFLYPKHALVLVNNEKDNPRISDKYGKEIYHASKMIINRIEKDFGITLEREVLVVE